MSSETMEEAVNETEFNCDMLSFQDSDNGLISTQSEEDSNEEVDCEELEEGMSLTDDHQCAVCEERFKQPRILSCLHTFCTECLQGKIEPLVSPSSAQEALTQALAPLCPGTIQCPSCSHVTRLGPRGVTDLAIDYVLVNILDMADIEDQQIICTSCKAQEKAVARCSDCANFLCPNCVTAHQFMRCFENHKVVSFEELRGKEGISIHKPIFCSFHDSENVKFFCNTCQIPICNECMLGEHRQPEHAYERIADLGERQIEELKDLVSEAKNKVSQCEEASTSLEGHLSELQMQRDNARGLIDETFQSYKAVLEKRKEALLNELEEIHTSQELHIMDLFQNVGKTIEKIEDSCKFTERVLKHGNSVEVLLVKKIVQDQILGLINSSPKPNVRVKINFRSDAAEFEKAIVQTFGYFLKKPTQHQEAAETSLHSSFDGEPFTLPGAILGDAANLLPPVSVADLIPAIANLPPLSLANLHPGVSVDVVDTAAMGAVDLDPTADIAGVRVGGRVDLSAITGATGDISSGASSAADIVGVSAHTINNIASSLQNLPIVGAGNSVSLSGVTPQLERSSSRNSYSPAMSDSGISVDAASTSSGQGTGHIVSTSFGAGSVFSKHGITVNSAGNVMMNGQMIPGFNIMSRGATPSTPTPDQNLANLLSSITPPGGSGGSGTPGSTSRSQTPQQLTDIANLLSQTSPNVPTSLAGLASHHAITGGASGMMSPQAGMLPPTTPTRVNLNLGAPPLPGPGSRGVTKMSAMQIRCKFGQLGPGKVQFNSPHGFCLGMDEDIVVADTNNHRIQVFEKTGEFKYQFGIPGREEGQLWYPRKVAVMRNSGKYVVCDRGNERSRMQIFTKNGHFIKKISIRYIDIVAGLAITQQGHIVAVDSVSPTVFCIAETGELIKWFDCSDYMREPSDIAISGKEYFVCDFKGHCVVVFNEDGQFVRRIGCENITNYPNGIDISDAGDVLIGDSHGNRFHVAVFQREGSLIGEFECPYVKVSRCCGLKITLEGYVVTLAKNNHHVLVLNTLYIA